MLPESEGCTSGEFDGCFFPDSALCTSEESKERWRQWELEHPQKPLSRRAIKRIEAAAKTLGQSDKAEAQAPSHIHKILSGVLGEIEREGMLVKLVADFFLFLFVSIFFVVGAVLGGVLGGVIAAAFGLWVMFKKWG